MGHKRKKFSERVAVRKTLGFDESPFKSPTTDTPKGFARIMFKKESLEKKFTEKRQGGGSSEDFGIAKGGKKNGKDNGKGAKKSSAADELRIQPGEKMGEFSRRVDDHMRDKLLKVSKDNSAAGSKKKKYFEKLKSKDKAKKLKAQEDKAYEEFETIQDKIRLNDVVEAPPTFTAVPKKRKNDEFMVNKKWKNTPGEEDYDDVIAEVDGKDKKRKLGDDVKPVASKKSSRLKSLTPAGRRIIEEERRQAIENYRLMKARKALERNPEQDDGAADDDAAAAAAGY
ncbi:hypothetical protein BGX27_004419 [Mortierella sp. AM989]|nr:hypothetical protein BGX27_004419 [Mortierella sp. AM989]